MAVIAFSRQLGALGDEVAREVASSLGYAYIDKEHIYGEAERFGLHRDDFEKFDEKKPSLRDRIFRDRLSLYKSLLQSIFLQFAKKGDTVIVGGCAHLILENIPGKLRVKILAHFDDRLTRIMEDEGVKKDEAASLINRSDNNRTGFMKHIFDADWTDATTYDLILNTSHIGKDEACRIIAGAATSERMQRESRDAHPMLQKLALTGKVEALLLADRRVDARYVSVSVEEQGIVTLKGMVNSEGEKQIVEAVAASAEEETRVVNELLVTVLPVPQAEPM